MPDKKQLEQSQMSNLKEAGNVIERKHVKLLLIYKLRVNLFHRLELKPEFSVVTIFPSG